MKKDRWWKADFKTRRTCANLIRYAKKQLKESSFSESHRSWLRGLMWGALIIGSSGMSRTQIPTRLQN